MKCKPILAYTVVFFASTLPNIASSTVIETDNCNAAMNLVIEDKGLPRSVSFIDPSEKPVTWWYWRKGVSVSFIWNEVDGTCDVGYDYSTPVILN